MIIAETRPFDHPRNETNPILSNSAPRSSGSMTEKKEQMTMLSEQQNNPSTTEDATTTKTQLNGKHHVAEQEEEDPAGATEEEVSNKTGKNTGSPANGDPTSAASEKQLSQRNTPGRSLSTGKLKNSHIKKPKNQWKDAETAENPWENEGVASAPNSGAVAWGSAPQHDSDSGSEGEGNDRLTAMLSRQKSNSSMSRDNNDLFSSQASLNFASLELEKSDAGGIKQRTPSTPSNRNAPLVESHVAVRVMKGEIHNVLTAMRSSDQSYISANRFAEELNQDHHPLVLQFLELHATLSDWDLQMAAQSLYKRANAADTSSVDLETPDALIYLPPFCTAITTREINASVTGACLTALHKFLLYGLVHPARDAKQGMTLIARALLHCTFEETAQITMTDRRRGLRQMANSQSSISARSVSSRFLGAGRSDVSVTSDVQSVASESQLTVGTRQTLRSQKSKSDMSKPDAAAPVNHPYYHPTHVTDEQVVLKLLDLAAMVVRCSFMGHGGACLITSDLVAGLLDTCLHVSLIAKSASPLLKSAAQDALAQIVLQVFCKPQDSIFRTPGARHEEDARNKSSSHNALKAREQVLAKLASLLDPSNHKHLDPDHLKNEQDDDSKSSRSLKTKKSELAHADGYGSITHPSPATAQVICSSLDAVNIALEHLVSETLSPREVEILQNDLCKYLLQWSITSDLHILSLTLRVIFNLFQSIQNHLKVPLEVFLTSVHLRILNQKSVHVNNYEEREVVLESILEFCQEPALMQDIYRNYDCDIACSDLYLQIVTSLAKASLPNNYKAKEPINVDNVTVSEGDEADAETTPQTPKKPEPTKQASTTVLTATPSGPPVAPITQLNKLALEGLLAILNSIARRVHADRSPFLQNLGASTSNGMSLSPGVGSLMDSSRLSVSARDLTASQHGLAMSEEELQQRRQRKNALQQVAEVFNEDPFGHEWLDMAVNLDVLDASDNPKAVAELLYTASGLDKAKVGIYLSKGPDSSYPFIAKTRLEFVGMYDFRDLPFAAGLRLFLSKFRLPGEAQCIDRFMEAFSNEFYKQQATGRGDVDSVGGDKEGSDNGNKLFHDADAVYVLSFSTIMLNTDLHNPGIKDESRMTLEQFIKNNRGINGGKDLPPEYLTELYFEIKNNQIQVQKEVGEFIKKEDDDENFKAAWDGILAKHREVATAFFTTASDARRNIFRAGKHDREMFATLVKQCMIALPAVFTESWDDIIVFKALRGLKQMCMIADHFDMTDTLNEVLVFMLNQGKSYVQLCIVQDFNPSFAMFPSRTASNRSLVSNTDEENDDTLYEDEDFDPMSDHIPYSLLSSGKGYSEVDYTGAAQHRGLLALDSGFLLVRRYARKIDKAWPIFLECLCVLRDAHALPAGLADLDDFADSQGQVLPSSPYARNSQKRLDNYYIKRALGNDPRYDREAVLAAQPQGLEMKSWSERIWGSLSGSSSRSVVTAATTSLTEPGQGSRPLARPERQMGEATRAVLGVAEAANVEKIVQMGSTKLPVAETTVRNLLDIVDHYPYEDDPVAEQHAIFSLELAARALLSNREKAVEIFPSFLAKFENILGRVPAEGEGREILSPFVIERIVVTILRCSIHLYDMEELRPNLRVSLHLLVMSLPRLFIRDIADRMACGLAIILRASFPFFESHNEWTFMGDTLDTLAHYASARVFVFDGIASTVECAMPHDEDDDAEAAKSERYPLTKEGCGALSRILIRFVLGFYQGDFSLSVPASVCLEKLYYHMNSLLTDEQIEALRKAGEPVPEMNEKERRGKVPNKDFWQNVAVAMYSVCRSPDPEVSRHGYEICQRVILRTPLREIPADKWLAILYLMVNKQPPTAADLSRANAFVLLGNMMMRILPFLSKRQRPPSDEDVDDEASNASRKSKHHDDNLVDGEDLADLVRLLASLAGENLRHGRRGTVSPLFEKTLQTVTYLSNHMQTDDWKGDVEFGMFASETLLAELEKVGAAGASLQNRMAVGGGEQETARGEKNDERGRAEGKDAEEDIEKEKEDAAEKSQQEDNEGNASGKAKQDEPPESDNENTAEEKS